MTNKCRFEWDGLSWVEVGADCAPGYKCAPPDYSGTFIGQRATTPCVPA